VAAFAAAALEPDDAEREVEVVVHDDQAVEAGLEETGGAHDGAAGQVHVGARLGQDDAAAGQASLEHLAAGAVRLEPAAGAGGEQLGDHEADVVPVAGVAGAGIAEPDHEGDLGQRRVGPVAATTADPTADPIPDPFVDTSARGRAVAGRSAVHGRVASSASTRSRKASTWSSS
jgi:hypothetical protein